MEIVENIVATGHGSLDPSYIVIHETANPGATALNHVKYWKNDSRFAVHYVGDWTGVVYHCVPDNRMCWQVGSGNPYVVGIELCHATNQADFEAVWNLGVEWAAWALSKFGWDTSRLLSHDDCRRIWGGTDHTDPLDYFESYGKSWEQFKQEVQEYLDDGGTEVITDADITAIAEKVAPYVWGYVLRSGNSAANQLLNTPKLTSTEILGYTNAAMNGDDDVYQILTDNRKYSGWDYMNTALESGDTYQILRDIRDTVVGLQKDIEELRKNK